MSSTFDENTQPEICTLVRMMKPDRIEDLWRQNTSNTSTVHIQVENMELWVTDDEVSDLLNDEVRLGEMVGEFTSKCLSLGIYCQPLNERLEANNSIFVNPRCIECNNPYDYGNCQHSNSPNRIPMLDPDAIKLVHETQLMLSVINYLLVQDHLNNTNRLAQMLCIKQEDGWSSNWMDNIGRQSDVPPITYLLGLLDNCSHAFPKVSQNAAGMLSLLICMDPASAFSCLDGKAFVVSTYKYFGEVFRLVHNSECMVEEYFGVVAFLNILPAVYHFGMWNEPKSSRTFNVFLASFASLLCNILYGATCGVRQYNGDADAAGLDAITDEPKDLREFPEMGSAKVFWESLLLVKDDDDDQSTSSNLNLPREWRIKLLHDSPRTFAVMAGIEVLGWWTSKGIDLTRADIPITDGPSQKFSDFLKEDVPRIRLLIRGLPQNEVISPYVERIVDAIMNNKKLRPKVPSPVSSLLYGPFYYDSRRCGLCHKTEKEVGHSLLSCAGGCHGLEQYCSKEHQKQDWPKHKFWCKKNATYTQYPGSNPPPRATEWN